ncbi:hypothetical protein GGF46_004978 [Coemansia sp. RSA 552]|nr:hypothetical protein GGF46_004978 [Coemansia sp. RSA 552]
MMSYRDMANDLTSKVKQALERRDELVKHYRGVSSELRITKAENDHLLDMILHAYPELGEDLSSCSSSDEQRMSQSEAEGEPARRNGKRDYVDSPLPPLLGTTPRMTKRRRQQHGKRDDRNDPKPITPLPRDTAGRIVFPIVIGKGPDQIEVHDLGRVVWSPDAYHTSRYIWTAGFCSKRICPSVKTGDPGCVYTSEILEGTGTAPVFQVTAADMPEKPFRANSSSGVWKQILDILTANGVGVKTHASGPQMYGLSHLGITKAIQELENADKCAKYIMQKWADPDRPDPDGPDPHRLRAFPPAACDDGPGCVAE